MYLFVMFYNIFFRMKRKLIILFLFLTGTLVSLYPQGGGQAAIVKDFYIHVGGAYATFQDTKYSDVRENGAGMLLQFVYGHLKEGKHYWEGGFLFDFTMNHAVTHDEGASMLFYPKVYGKYLRAVNGAFYVGARVDLYDNYIRVYTNLVNNSVFATSGSYLYGSVLYRRQLNDRWRLEAGGELALLGVQKEGTGFAMNYSQNRIEKGGVDYQDPKLGDPSNYAYAEFKWLGDNLILRTEFMMHYRKRIALGYAWEMRRFATVPDYPTTWGMHNLVFRINVVHREK